MRTAVDLSSECLDVCMCSETPTLDLHRRLDGIPRAHETPSFEDLHNTSIVCIVIVSKPLIDFSARIQASAMAKKDFSVTVSPEYLVDTLTTSDNTTIKKDIRFVFSFKDLTTVEKEGVAY
ncbi:hypothetical protein H0H93_014464, partial [Arthromyces matolae]